MPCQICYRHQCHEDLGEQKIAKNFDLRLDSGQFRAILIVKAGVTTPPICKKGLGSSGVWIGPKQGRASQLVQL